MTYYFQGMLDQLGMGINGGVVGINFLPLIPIGIDGD